jgi:hypothetical protein
VSVAFLPLLTVGCGPAAEQNEVDNDDGCGPNSSFSESHDHCHCDDGFEIEGTACLPIDDDEDEDDEDDDDVAALDLKDAVVTGQSTTDSQGDAVYILQAVASDVVLRIEGYVGFGAPQSATAVVLEGDDLDYATCAVCVVVQTGCDAHDDHFHCSKTYMPVDGGIDFSALDPVSTMAGHLHDVTLQPVDIDSSNQTTPVAGSQLRVAHWDFSTSLVEQ